GGGSALAVDAPEAGPRLLAAPEPPEPPDPPDPLVPEPPSPPPPPVRRRVRWPPSRGSSGARPQLGVLISSGMSIPVSPRTVVFASATVRVTLLTTSDAP